MAIQINDMADTSLTGAKEIASFMGYSWQTIYKMIQVDGFPATKIRGRWASDRKLILNWKREKIKEQNV